MNRPDRSDRRRSAFTLIELLVVMAIIGLLVAMLMPAIQSARESARQTACLNNIRQIALACNIYVNDQGCFPTGLIESVDNSMPMMPVIQTQTDLVSFLPPTRIPTANGQTISSISQMNMSQWWGWQAFLLPQMGERTMNLSFVHDIAGMRAAADKTKMQAIIKSYICPTASFGGNGNRYGYSNYRGNLGVGMMDPTTNAFVYQGGMFLVIDPLSPPAQSAIANRDVQDGESQTMLLGESLFGFWGDGTSCCASERSDRSPPIDFPAGANPSEWGFGSWHKDIILIAMVDGSAHKLKKNLNRQVLQRLLQRNDGQNTGDWQN